MRKGVGFWYNSATFLRRYLKMELLRKTGVAVVIVVITLLFGFLTVAAAGM